MILTPLSLKARREALGLGQLALARILDTTQQTINRWERGERAPENPVSVDMTLAQLEDDQSAIEDAQIEAGESPSAIENYPGVTLYTYASDQTFWRANPDAAQIPAAFHRIATARAATTLRDELSIQARIETT